MTAVYLVNRSPTRALLGNISPFEAFTGQKPSYSNLHVFGSICYSKPNTGTKLDVRSQKCIFLGYVPNGYRVLDLENYRIQPVRNVVFDDTKLFKHLPQDEKEIALQNFNNIVTRPNTTTAFGLSSTSSAARMTLKGLGTRTRDQRLESQFHRSKTYRNKWEI